eukprot:Clim_evm13s21 gene=Clim_evmTU13s21
MRLARWHQRARKRLSNRKGSIAVDEEHQQLLRDDFQRSQKEVPVAVSARIKEHAYSILLDTVAAYKSELGARHPLYLDAIRNANDIGKRMGSIRP